MLSHWMATVIQVLPPHRKELFLSTNTLVRLQAVAMVMGLENPGGKNNNQGGKNNNQGGTLNNNQGSGNKKKETAEKQRAEARILGRGKPRI